jgi:MraZ protein
LAFRGHYEHSLDSKDRLTVPARFRAALADGVVLAKGLEPSVWVFTPESYARFTGRVLGDVNPLGSQGRMLRRHFHGNSYDGGLDSAGRIRLPRPLVEHAALEGPCVVVGMDDWFEIWNAESWGSYEEEMKAAVAEAAENLAEGG